MRRRGNVNFDHDNPLRLRAVAEDRVHYFTGLACVRGHVANRFSKTGRCVDCCHQDRRKYMQTPNGKALQRRQDDSRYIRKRGKAYTPSRGWHMRLALYEHLVAAGLPVDPTVTLSKRVHLAWNAYQELTDDDSPASRATQAAMRRAMRHARQQAQAANQQERATRKQARKQERAEEETKRVPIRAERRRIRALIERGLAMGLLIHTMRARHYNQGWDWERACTTPAVENPHNGIAAAAREAGLRIGTVEYRIRAGWSREEALKTPLHALKPNSRAAQAVAAGLTPTAVDNRIRRGWTLAEALSVPLNPHHLTPDEHVRRQIARLTKIVEREVVQVAVERKAKRESEAAERRTLRRVKLLRREAAAEAGHRTFENPLACKKCGGSNFYTSCGTCQTCVSHQARRRYVPVGRSSPLTLNP